MRCPEGIDKVDVLLNPLFFDKRNIANHKYPYHRLVLRPAGAFWALSIQAEWFNPFLDYQMQVALAVHEIVKEGVLSYLFFGCPFTPSPQMIYLCHECFFLNVIALEFYSDGDYNNFKRDENMMFKTIDEAKENGGLYRYYDKDKDEPTDTCYSVKKKNAGKSSFICYNRLRKSIIDNNIAGVDELRKTQKPIRCEFKLYSCNTEWLHWDNLRGNYQDIFNRYTRYLATVFNTKVAGCITVKGNENPNFKKVIKVARKENNTMFKNRKHTPNLKSKETWPKDVLHPERELTADELVNRRNEMVVTLKKVPANGENSALEKRLEEIAKNRIESTKNTARMAGNSESGRIEK
jgi:hypothetical protein